MRGSSAAGLDAVTLVLPSLAGRRPEGCEVSCSQEQTTGMPADSPKCVRFFEGFSELASVREQMSGT